MSTTPIASKPAQTQASVRHYKDGAYLPAHIESIAGVPSGKGGQLAEYSLDPGHRLPFIVTVDQANKIMQYFKFANDTNKNEEPLRAVMTRDREGHSVIASYEGRDTTTNNPFAHYILKGQPHNGVTHEVDPPSFYLQIDAPSGKACKVPLWHQDNQ